MTSKAVYLSYHGFIQQLMILVDAAGNMSANRMSHLISNGVVYRIHYNTDRRSEHYDVACSMYSWTDRYDGRSNLLQDVAGGRLARDLTLCILARLPVIRMYANLRRTSSTLWQGVCSVYGFRSSMQISLEAIRRHFN